MRNDSRLRCTRRGSLATLISMPATKAPGPVDRPAWPLISDSPGQVHNAAKTCCSRSSSSNRSRGRWIVAFTTIYTTTSTMMPARQAAARKFPVSPCPPPTTDSTGEAGGQDTAGRAGSTCPPHQDAAGKRNHGRTRHRHACIAFQAVTTPCRLRCQSRTGETSNR